MVRGGVGGDHCGEPFNPCLTKEVDDARLDRATVEQDCPRARVLDQRRVALADVEE
jgi:hypothetical protein